jgi:hypothetical protein
MSEKRAFVSDDLQQLVLFDLHSVDRHGNATVVETKDYRMPQPVLGTFVLGQ